VAMTQRLVIETSDRNSLRPLLESALEREKKLLHASIDKARVRVAEFEKRFGMVSAEFERRLNASELEESVAFTDWRMEMGMLAVLEQRYRTLEGSQIVD